ncbi:MAG: hypothetical protein EU548_00105 [Promethearchaeota archaeon]|nr:MAG: hypothetical protein EU548_00105 [Candidatus Lokiarchaeota archaeon]
MSEKKSKEEEELDEALEKSKKAGSALHGLLKRFEGAALFKRKEEEEEFIEPKLDYEKKKEIAESYAMEDVPLSERPSIKKRPSFADTIPITEKEAEAVEPQAKVAKPVAAPKKPSVEGASEKVMIYQKLTNFFENYLMDYRDTYNRWEDSISNILSVLRKMRKITKKNTEELTSFIENTYSDIEAQLEQFKIKRDQIEKASGVNIETMSGEFKKVLGLLELQIKEYQLKRVVDDYIHHRTLFSE